jgi:hypothetical protein
MNRSPNVAACPASNRHPEGNATLRLGGKADSCNAGDCAAGVRHAEDKRKRAGRTRRRNDPGMVIVDTKLKEVNMQ